MLAKTTSELISRLSFLTVTFLLLENYFPQSRIPLMVYIAGAVATMRGSTLYTRALHGAMRYVSSLHLLNTESLHIINDEQEKLIIAIKTLQNYQTKTLAWNQRRRDLYRLMSWKHQKLATDVGYNDRLNKVDKAIGTNQAFLNDVALRAIETHGLTYMDLQSVKLNANHDQNYRVIESLGHFPRDWAKDDSERELGQLLTYFKEQISVIPDAERAETCVIVPGSGLGRVAHELAVLPDSTGDTTNVFGKVHAVEFSHLMHLCNDFIYEGGVHKFKSKTAYDIHAHVSTHSNHVSAKSQLRTSRIERIAAKPANLELHLADFIQFAPDLAGYKNVVIASCFFIDTAQNLFQYLDAMVRLTNGKDKGYWINVGPLKYGTAAQVEFTLEELREVREVMGWKVLDDSSYDRGGTELAPYLTDIEGLWQGYYGLTKWCCERRNE